MIEDSIFTLRKLDWNSTEERRLSKFVCSNNVLVAAVSNRSGSSVLRWNLESRSQEDEIEISRKVEDSIQAIFIDPTGNHVIISMSNGDNFYLHSRSSRPKKISRLQGAIESVAFDKRGSNESSTRSFLAGTSQGCVYEFVVDSSGKEKLCNLVFQLASNDAGVPMAITSIHFDVIQKTITTSSTPDSPGKTRLFVVLATTSPTRLYNFTGGANFQQLFGKYKEKPLSFTEFPGETPRAELILSSFSKEDSGQMFCLGTKEGIYHGTLRFSDSSVDAADEMVQAKLMPFTDRIFTDGPPLCIVPTEYHFLTLGYDKIRAISRLNGSLVQEEVLRVMDGGGVGLVRDPVRNTLWYYSDTYVFQISTVNEDRFLWTIYLQKAKSGDESMFDVAYNHCRSPEDRAKIMQTRAEFLLARGEVEKAGAYFARSEVPFEDAVLRLMSNVGAIDYERGKAVAPHLRTAESFAASNLRLATTDGPELTALRVYLQEKLRLLSVSAKSQRTMICTWLCEIFLHQMSMIRLNSTWSSKAEPSLEGGGAGRSFPTPASVTDRMTLMKNASGKSVDALEAELSQDFKSFLSEHTASLEKITTISLIASRAQESNRHILLFYAQLIGDYDSVVGHFVSEARHTEAITMLQEAPLDAVEALVYKHAPVLVEFQPELSMKMFLGKRGLKVSKLLPALLRYESLFAAEQEQNPASDAVSGNWAILYLLETFRDAKMSMQVCESSLCHTLAWFLSKYDKEESHLCTFLEDVMECREDCLLPDGVYFQYLLTQCKRFERRRGLVYVYLLVAQEQTAMECALGIDLELAKTVAKTVSKRAFTDAKKKSLWLLVASHVVKEDVHAKGALGLIQESDGYLQIEDLLPLLPEFTEIDLFKEEICLALEQSESQIETLKAEMEELSESAEAINDELDSMKKRGFSVSSAQRCEHCKGALFSNQFYLFPCSHGFHTNCLLEHTQHGKHLDAAQLETVKSMERQIRELSSNVGDVRSATQLEYLQNELDSYVAADCPLCGYVMIQSLAVPLVAKADELEAISWAL